MAAVRIRPATPDAIRFLVFQRMGEAFWGDRTTLADLFGRCDPGLPGLPLAISMPPTLWSPMPRVLTPGRQ
jgi:hypothetical protein